MGRGVRHERLDRVRRGDLVTVALQGDQGKPRPGLVIQADPFADLPAVTVLPITSTLLEAPLLRIAVAPTPTKRADPAVADHDRQAADAGSGEGRAGHRSPG